MRKYFFEDTVEAILYLIFLSLLPMASIGTQYILQDRTMYVSILVAAFAMTYDYIVLLKRKTVKRLFWEAIIATICVIATMCIAIVNLLLLLAKDGNITYTIKDMLFSGALVIMVLVNVYEFVLFLKSEYQKKFVESDDNVVLGAKRV